jgi:hypothetical protein
VSALPLAIPELRQALEDVGALRSEVRRLSNRVDDFERRQSAERGDLDRVLNLRETAAAIGKAAPTLRHWIADAALFDRHMLAALLRKDSSGRWVSSPRLVARYKQVAFRALVEVCK